MAARDVTQADLAVVLNVSQQSVSRRVSGRQSFTVTELAAVASFLEVDVRELLADVAA